MHTFYTPKSSAPFFSGLTYTFAIHPDSVEFIFKLSPRGFCNCYMVIIDDKTLGLCCSFGDFFDVLENNYDMPVLLGKLEDSCPTFVKLFAGELDDTSVTTLVGMNETVLLRKFAVGSVNIPLEELVAAKGLRQAASETIDLSMKIYREIYNQTVNKDVKNDLLEGFRK